jgi:hypothetical protein
LELSTTKFFALSAIGTLAPAVLVAEVLAKGAGAILNATLDLELRRTIGDRFGEAESLFTQAPLARAEGRDADVVGLLGAARRRRVEIGDRPGIAECNAELARLPQRPVPA